MNDTPVWDDGDGESLPTLDGDRRAEVCVVGLGGSGLACIGELLRLGRSVVGIDAGSVAGGAAGRNGGFLLAGLAMFYHRAAELIGRGPASRIYRATMAEIDRMTSETPGAIRRTGSLRIAADRDEERDCEAQIAAMRADGLPGEPYHGPEGSGVLVPTDAVCNPLQRCREMVRRLRHDGAVLCERSAAEEVGTGHVVTARGVVRCDTVIVAVDGKLERLLPELAPRVRTARLQMLATAPDASVTWSRPVYRRYGYDYWQQLPDRRIALGGLRDKAGDSEWTTSTSTTDDVQHGLERVLRDDVKATAAVTHRWAASVGYTDDRLPVIAEVRQSVWAIGGYSGTGNVVGALCGRGVARLAVAGDPELLGDLLRR